MAQRFIHVLVYIWFAQTQTSSLHLFAIQSLGTWAPTAFTPMHDSQLCTYSRSSGLWSFVEFMSFASIYHQTNRCRYQNTTPKNLLSNMFPFTPAKKKKRKTRDSSSSLLLFHLIELHPALAFGNLRFGRLAATATATLKAHPLEWIWGKNLENLMTHKKTWKEHLLEIPRSILRKNAHDKLCPNFVRDMKAETLKLHIDIGYRSCSDLGNPMGAIKDQKGSPFKNRGPKCGRFIGQLWPT